MALFSQSLEDGRQWVIALRLLFLGIWYAFSISYIVFIFFRGLQQIVD